MDEKKKIAIVGLSTLESLGLKHILREVWSGRLESFGDFAAFYPFAEKTEGFIIGADTFAANVDFFLPRKQKTLVITGDVTTMMAAGSFFSIGVKSDEANLKSAVAGFISCLDDKIVSRGELSSREKEVLRLIATGKLNKEIADELCISVNTVITHRKNLSSKLGIKSASGLSLYAVMNGIL